jgi:large subunit ribosomal protein L4
MIDLSVYNREGQEVESLKVDESAFGGVVRHPLLKQAIVMYQANKRLGTAATKGRSMVAGSKKKLFRQKGTGRARIGNIRTGKRVGGGMTFAKVARDFRKRMPKKQRRLATASAILAKLLSNNVVVVDELKFEQIGRSCLVTVSAPDVSLHRQARNIPRVAVMPVAQLNAGDVCNFQKMLFTKDAFLSLLDKDKASED